MRMGIKEAIEYLYLNFSYDELIDDGVHIAVATIANVYGKDVEYIKAKIKQFHEQQEI